MRVRLPSLVMLNLDWTCVTELSSLQYLRENGEAYRMSFTFTWLQNFFQCMHVQSTCMYMYNVIHAVCIHVACIDS